MVYIEREWVWCGDLRREREVGELCNKVKKTNGATGWNKGGVHVTNETNRDR